MAIALKGVIGTGVSAVSTTTCALTTATTTGSVGDMVIVFTGFDNTSTTDGDNSEVTGIADNVGNTYVKLGEYTNSPTGAAADGCAISVWMSRITTQLSTGSTVTATYNGARTMKVLAGLVWTVASGNTLTLSAARQTAEVTGANDFGSASFSGLPSKERLYFSAVCKEANTTTANTVSSGFTGSGVGNRSANNAAAVTAKSEYRINTSTGETSNPTLAVSGDTAMVFVALEEVTFTVTAALSGAAATAAVGVVGVALSLALSGLAGTSAVGTATPALAKALTGTSGAAAVGSLSSAQSLSLSGVNGASSAGTFGVAQTIGLSGESGSGGIGDVSTGQGPSLTGNAATGSVGTFNVSSTLPVTGVAGTGAVGTVTMPNLFPLNLYTTTVVDMTPNRTVRSI